MPAKRKFPTMATHLNLPLETHAVLMALCEATGQKPSRLITDLLIQSEPQFKALTKAALLAKTTPKAAVGVLEGMIDEALAQAGVSRNDLHQLDLLVA